MNMQNVETAALCAPIVFAVVVALFTIVKLLKREEPVSVVTIYDKDSESIVIIV